MNMCLVYSNIEILVLWAKLEITGFAVIHWLSNGKRHPSGMKSKPGALGQDSLLDPIVIPVSYLI